MSDNDGLVHAYVLDGNGGGKKIGWSEIRTWSEVDGTLWVHLDYSSPESIAWLEEESGLDEVVVSALISENPRPRSALMFDGLLVMLRGVNMNPGADPEDMVSMRLWINDKRIISTRRRKILSVQDISRSIDRKSVV